MTTVCAIVVTHNRRELLMSCLERLGDQTRPADEVLVVDNASTDGTAAMVRERFPWCSVVRLDDNVGGAGGFHEGMRRAHAAGHAWLWLMDDDTFTEPDTLATLLAGAGRAPAGSPPILVSQALWKDGSLHPMNRPRVRWGSRGDVALGVERGLIAIRSATFVSLLAHREAVDRFGLVLAHYFIWGDDFEWTSRVLRDEAGYLVPESRVTHYTERAHTAMTAPDGSRFYFHVRNSVFILRGSSLTRLERLAFLRFWLGTLRQYLHAQGRSRDALGVLARGLRDGIRGAAR